jgi:hypothetical protein
MKPTSPSFCCAAILSMAVAILFLHAQPAAARALFAYPMQGQSPEQENADRAACHQWAVEQSGFDPFVGLPVPERTGVLAGVAINAQPGPTGSGRRVGTGGGGFGSTMTQAEIRRHNELNDAYLRAGQVCLEARGYQVSR